MCGYSQSRRIVLATIFAAIMMPASLARAGDTDAHLSQRPSSALFQRSVFAHGYIHGYEEGFHWGNLDFQTGRASSHPKESRAAKSTYERTFGSRTRFKAGYHRGFLAGYSDGAHGREFRAIEAAKQAAQDLSDVPGDAKQFDAGLSDGYDLGSVHGHNAFRDNDRFDAETDLCSVGDARERPSHPPQYCSGFVRGYSMGYSDGYLGGSRQDFQAITADKKEPQKP